MKRRIFSLLGVLMVLALIGSACSSQVARESSPVVTDVDGTTYKTVRIGEQIWMAENLQVTHFRIGDAIPEVTVDEDWAMLQSSALSTTSNTTDLQVIETYGRLYNWYAVNDIRGLAPEGWHIPTVAEWQELVDYLGGNAAAGGSLKASGTDNWLNPNTAATNSSGFTALPGGNRDGNGGNFSNFGRSAYFALDGEDEDFWYAFLDFESGEVLISSDVYLTDGFSIRCIKDDDL